MDTPADAVVLGLETSDPHRPLHLSPSGQALHGLVWGTTGSGKSRYLASQFLQHLSLGHGVCLIDPHGDLASLVLATCARRGFFRRRDAFSRLVYADFGAGHLPFNVLAGRGDPHTRALCALEGMTRTWPEVQSAPLFATVFLSAALVLIKNNLPITELNRLLLDRAFRQQALSRVDDPLVHQSLAAFDRGGVGQAGSTLRRAFLLAFSPVTRSILGHTQNALDIRAMMDGGTSLIANLGTIPDPVTRRLVGSLLLAQIEQAALSRADSPESSRRPWTCLVDEWPSFAASSAESLDAILSQTRKYGLRLQLAAQSLAQVDSDRLAGALENCRLSVTFRLGHSSARVRAGQLVATDSREQAPSRAPRGSDRPPSATERQAEWVHTLTHLPPRRAVVQIGEAAPRMVTTLNVADHEGASTDAREAADLYRRFFARTYRTSTLPREPQMPPTASFPPDILEEHADPDNPITNIAAFFGEDIEVLLPR